ncbi:potassium/proton antiporter [Brevibacillus laterosporus]|uniref:Potassium/proton antiporter n=1 Tax=Brevibacillus halotolerans TaxID=1507437 RepID=A0ABT4I0P0_9BACL|nr:MULTISPECIES: potassium/proton antiporter [Brevibacillus]MCR8986893.1 potassium/proton antiporter [Brevibacillus laterosporus]MCZ0832629.1 potassium/proton antiporter [Brevibacillus halotolerans]
MIFTTDNIILLLAVLLVTGVVTAKFSSRIGLPSLVFFVGVGMILSKFIYYDNASLTQLFGILALIIILFDGGMQTKWTDIRAVAKPSLSLATIGVVLTTFLIGACAKFILGLSWNEGLLFGAIVGSTDAAAVFAVLGNKNIKKRLTSVLEAESGTNDPMAMFLTIALIEFMQYPEVNVSAMILEFLWEMGLGLVMGYLLGKISTMLIKSINLDSSGLYPVLSIALAVLAYGATSILGGSGLLAVYVMAVFVGNVEIPYRHSILRFNEAFAWMMQILMFILLGLLVFPSDLLEVIWQGIALSFLLMFVARPIGVYVSTLGMSFSIKERAFIAWSGLRGAVPIVLATYPLIAGLENAQLIFNVVFFVVLTSALIQGATISPLANWFGFSKGEKTVAPYSLELVSLAKTNAEMIEVHIRENSNVVGTNLLDLQLSDQALVNAIIRGKKLLIPKGDTILQAGDILYVLGPKTEQERIKQLFSEERSNREEEHVQREEEHMIIPRTNET